MSFQLFPKTFFFLYTKQIGKPCKWKIQVLLNSLEHQVISLIVVQAIVVITSCALQVAQYASDNGNGKAAFNDVDHCLRYCRHFPTNIVCEITICHN